MKSVQKSEPKARRPYRKPTLKSYTEQEILAAIGPAQGYGTKATMPLDNEWVRGS
jgi:hypothetical protein